MGDPISETKVINRQKVFSEFDSLPHQELAHSPELIQEVARLFNSAFAGRDVYECGCSEGNTIRHFGIPARLYRGVDPSRKAIDTIKAAFPEYAGRIFHSSFEESVRYWSHSNAVILATFGTASYIMQPYLKILAESGLDYFLMFYREGFCPEEFRQMHHFEYTDVQLQEIFLSATIISVGDYKVCSSKPLNLLWK